MDEVGLGQALQNERKKAGLTQQELCDKASLSYSTLAKIERGAIRAPSVFTIYSVVQVLGITMNDLFPALTQPNKCVSKSGIRFIYFDVNGCLVRFYHRAFTEIARDSGKQADIIETAFWHLNDTVCAGGLSMAEFNHQLGQRFDLPDFDWLKYYLAAVEPIQAMHETVTWAAELYEVGLLTNIMPGQLAAMLQQGLIPSADYTTVIDSSEVKLNKPDPAIFAIAAENCGYPSNEILLVDDSRANIVAAEKAGWNVLWFDDYRPEESAARVRQALEPAS